MTLVEFENIFKKDISPFYIKNQNIFDQDGIHGCLHISRSLIISRLIAKKLKESAVETNIDAISYAISFHDSGRKGNGKDVWEKDSSLICYNYLKKAFIPDAEYISSLIVKDNSKDDDFNYLVCYDTDVLEIIRPTTGIGLQNFNSKYLKLMPVFQNYYNNIMNEVFGFILETEGMNKRFENSDALFNLMLFLKFKNQEYPMLYAATNT